MRNDPAFAHDAIGACLSQDYGIIVSVIQYLPVGLDLQAFVYEAVGTDGRSWFLKVRRGPVNEAALEVPHALVELGIGNILAPLPTRTGNLWSQIDDRISLVVYPCIRGQDAMSAVLTDDQIREFGATLWAVHNSGLEARFGGSVHVEDFSLPSAALVRDMLELAKTSTFTSPEATRLARFLRENDTRIRNVLAGTGKIGHELVSQPLERVLCHADIHAANILVGDDRRIWLIDWDGPLIAPRERDLFFVVGSRIARTWMPREETLFLEGYGAVKINEAALVYARYERIIEDIGEFAKSVFLDPHVSEEMRAHQVNLATSFFAPGGDIDRAETVLLRW